MLGKISSHLGALFLIFKIKIIISTFKRYFKTYTEHAVQHISDTVFPWKENNSCYYYPGIWLLWTYWYKFICCSVSWLRLTLQPHARLPCLHYLPEFALEQTHVHWVNDAIQPSHPLSPPSPPALNLSRHHSLSQGVSSLHQVVNLSISPSNAYSGLIWLPTPVFLPGEFHGHRSLADYSPWGCRVRHNWLTHTHRCIHIWKTNCVS